MKTKFLTLCALAMLLLGGSAMAQTVTVTINPTPKHTVTADGIICADSIVQTYKATNASTATIASVSWRVLSDASLAAGNIQGVSNIDSVKVIWEAVTAQKTGKIEFTATSNETCIFVDTITITINPAPTITLLASSLTACVSNSVNLTTAFIASVSLGTNDSVRFYTDQACTTLMANPYLPAGTGIVDIYARLENSGSCFSQVYHLQLDVKPEPMITLNASVNDIATDTAKVCYNVAINLIALVDTATATGVDSLQFSLNSDFSTIIANPTVYKPDFIGTDTIFVRALNTTIDLACITSTANVQAFKVHVDSAITNVLLAVDETGHTGTTETLCESELTTGTVLKLKATMEGGSKYFTDLKYKLNSGSETATTPNAGASPLSFTVPAEIDGTAKTYKITYAVDSNGCIYTNP